MNKKIKILLVSNTSWSLYNFRGELIKLLLRLKFDITVVAEEDKYSKYLIDWGCKFIGLKIDRHGVNPFLDSIYFLNLLIILIKERPKIFFGFTIKPNIYGSIAAKLIRIYTVNNITGLGEAFNNSRLLRSFVMILYKIAFKNSSLVFFQNLEDMNLFKRYKLSNPESSILLPGSGVNLRKFYLSKKDHSQKVGKNFQFIFIGRLIISKGIQEYINAARILVRKGLNVEFNVAGALDEKNKNTVRLEELRRWEAEGVIRYLGFSDDVRGILMTADCVVHPSYSEGLPRVLLESAAMGRPIISTDIPGSNSIVLEGYNGYLVQPRNAQDLAKKMEKMYRLSPYERERFGLNAREIVTTQYSVELVLQEYLNVLNRLLGKNFSQLVYER